MEDPLYPAPMQEEVEQQQQQPTMVTLEQPSASQQQQQDLSERSQSSRSTHSSNTPIPSQKQHHPIHQVFYWIYAVKTRALPLFNLFILIVVFILSALSQSSVINNLTNAVISDKYTTWVTPANYAFSIWGVIYFFYVVYALTDVLVGVILGRYNIMMQEKMGFAYSLMLMFHAVWFIFFNFEMLWTSVVIIICYTLSLIYMYVRMGVNYKWREGWLRKVDQDLQFGFVLQPIINAVKSKKNSQTHISDTNELEMKEKQVIPQPIESQQQQMEVMNSMPKESALETTLQFFVNRKKRTVMFWEILVLQPNISIQMAWLTVATILNIAVGFTGTNNGQLFGVAPTTWAAVMQSTATVIAFLLVKLRGDYLYSAVVSWALIATAIKFQSNPTVLLSASINGGVTAAFTLFGVVKLVWDFGVWAFAKSVDAIEAKQHQKLVEEKV